MKRLLPLLLLAGCATTQTKPVDLTPLPTTIPQTTVVATVPETTTTTVAPTTTTSTLVPADAKCAELAPIASAAGWPDHLLIDVLDEAWNESRCLNIIDGHKNFNGWDRGPLQINQVWLNEIEDKYGSWEYVKDPYYNFAWAWEMYKWYDYHRGCGFKPWSRPCK